MSQEIRFLGGSAEVGANSCYIYLDGTGIIIDAGLHPEKRDKSAFPDYSLIEEQPVDQLIITHSHNDHIGAIPYLLKYNPQVKMLSTIPTRDLVEIMLKDTSKLLKKDFAGEIPEDMLSLYKPDILKKIFLVIEGIKYKKEVLVTGAQGTTEVKIQLYPSGHILGSASVLIESSGRSILHTSDINFRDQHIIPGAELPRHHVDTLIIESTNAAEENMNTYAVEKKRLAAFINQIADSNGSVLIPVFALGKAQEMLRIIYNLMRSGKIPHLPLYTGGLMKKISRVYDIHCYGAPMIKPGFEVSDIPQLPVRYDELLNGKYFRESSIVLIPSGMLNNNTLSHRLAQQWFSRKNFGIALVGYQAPDSPGYALQNSELKKKFVFGNKKAIRICGLESFRFTSHAVLEDLLAFISDVKPKRLFIVHGDQEASEHLALKVTDLIPGTRILIPESANTYNLDNL